MKFLINTVYDYMPKIGGVVALHKLGSVLSELNEEVYVICNNTIQGSNATCINQETARSILNEDNTAVLIYPEVIYGNPLQAKNVVRWVLYTPGLNGGDPVYNENEHVFLYRKEFGANTIYADYPILFTFLSKTDFFYDMGLERSGDCFLRKKGEKIHNQFADGFYIDDGINLAENIDEFLLETFNRYDRFISYDTFTYYSSIAALCGCTSIVIPNPNISRELFYTGLNAQGVAYGYDEEEHSVLTKNLVKPYLDNLYQESVETVKSFVNYCKSNFS